MDTKSRYKELLSRLDDVKKEVTKQRNKEFDYTQEYRFALLSDEEVALVLAHRAKGVRIEQNRKQSDVAHNAGLRSTSTYSNFEQTGVVTLQNFIKIIRSLGRIEELEQILHQTLDEKIKRFEKNSLKAPRRSRVR